MITLGQAIFGAFAAVLCLASYRVHGTVPRELREMLIEVRDKCLIYWQAQTTRGIVQRALMFENIERVLRGEKRRAE
jgi:hypothetical protein